MNVDYYELAMRKIAEENNLELTDSAYNIARFRARTGLPMDKCPCAPNAAGRGCIGPKCWEEIKTVGVCHCNCFRRKSDD